MSWEQLNITHSHLILENVKLLNHMNMNLLKHNNTPWSLYVEKHGNAYEASMKWSSKDGVKKQNMTWSNKQPL